jgi:hypothetical protein
VTVIVTKTPRNEPNVVRQARLHGVVGRVQHGSERQAGRVGTALGLLITQRSRVQIPPRYQGRRPFLEQRKGLLR